MRELWVKNQKNIHRGLVAEFGEEQSDLKRQNFVDIGPMPFSIIAFHNQFARQIRNSFVVGSYYPALTGVGALCERILNHLLRELREDYADTPEYRKIFRKNSFDNWRLAIDTLSSWGILTSDAAEAFEQLLPLRNSTIHFQPKIDQEVRTPALEAIALLDKILVAQFPVAGTQPWFLSGTPGESYISQAWETRPFIKRIYLPNCLLVGPAHRIESLMPECIVHDRGDYVDRSVSDEEFADLRGKAAKAMTSVVSTKATPPGDNSSA